MESSRIGLPIGTNLDRFIKGKQKQFPYATGELSQLLSDIALAGKVVNREINKAGLVDISISMDSENIHGEHQSKLDVLADIRFKRALEKGGQACAIASEESEKPTILNIEAKYIVCIDPLDGSSNLNVNVSIGTIFSIYRRVSPTGTDVLMEDFLQEGHKQVASGYLLYGSSTMLVYTTGHGVNGFTYEPSLGEYFLSHPDLKTPIEASLYSINEGNWTDFSVGLKAYLSRCKERRFSSRYIGSLVGDFHRNLLKGGIYIYPETKEHPQGKLRLLYECNALAFIVEQAGGLALSGTKNIMDIKPIEIYQRVPLYIGSRNMVAEVEKCLSDTNE